VVGKLIVATGLAFLMLSTLAVSAAYETSLAGTYIAPWGSTVTLKSDGTAVLNVSSSGRTAAGRYEARKEAVRIFQNGHEVAEFTVTEAGLRSRVCTWRKSDQSGDTRSKPLLVFR